MKEKLVPNTDIVFSKIQTPTQDLVPDINLKICYKFEKFDTILVLTPRKNGWIGKALRH